MNKWFFLSKTVWLAFLLHSALIFAGTLLSDQLSLHLATGFINQGLSASSPFIEKFMRWDAHWYTYIAEHGYDIRTVVFFPVIIALIKLSSYTGLSYSDAGFFVCNTFALVSFYVMYALIRLDFSEQHTLRALLAYSVMPTSFFLNSIYTEPIFISLSITCIYFSRRGWWWPAGIFAALSALTRNLGIFLFFFMLFEFILTYQKKRKFKPSVIPLLIAPIALFCYMIYNLVLTGDSLAFANSQQSWGRYFSYPWVNYWNSLSILILQPRTIEPADILDPIIVLLTLTVLIFLTFAPKFKIRPSYLVLGWLWFLIPLFSTSSWQPLYSLSRFVLIIFPLYIFLAQIRKDLFYYYLAISTIGLVVCTALFNNWYWLG